MSNSDELFADFFGEDNTPAPTPEATLATEVPAEEAPAESTPDIAEAPYEQHFTPLEYLQQQIMFRQFIGEFSGDRVVLVVVKEMSEETTKAVKGLASLESNRALLMGIYQGACQATQTPPKEDYFLMDAGATAAYLNAVAEGITVEAMHPQTPPEHVREFSIVTKNELKAQTQQAVVNRFFGMTNMRGNFQALGLSDVMIDNYPLEENEVRQALLIYLSLRPYLDARFNEINEKLDVLMAQGPAQGIYTPNTGLRGGDLWSPGKR
jgi:hypothetical protein